MKPLIRQFTALCLVSLSMAVLSACGDKPAKTAPTVAGETARTTAPAAENHPTEPQAEQTADTPTPEASPAVEKQDDTQAATTVTENANTVLLKTETAADSGTATTRTEVSTPTINDKKEKVEKSPKAKKAVHKYSDSAYLKEQKAILAELQSQYKQVSCPPSAVESGNTVFCRAEEQRLLTEIHRIQNIIRLNQ